MPDSEKVAGTSLEQFKAALTSLTSSWPGEDTAPEQPKVPPQAEAAATRARKKYDGILHWMLSIFGAIGLLIFGSLPFVDLKDVNPWAGAVWGLLLAGLGIAIVVAASTIGLEPQDASLGELAQNIVRKPLLDRKLSLFDRVFRPRRCARYRLSRTLTESEKEAHLGPGIESIPALISRIGQLEALSLQLNAGWDGKGAVPKSDDQKWKESSSTAAAIAKSSREQINVALLILAELRQQLANTKDLPEEDRSKLIDAIAEKVAAVVSLLDEVRSSSLDVVPGSIREPSSTTIRPDNRNAPNAGDSEHSIKHPDSGPAKQFEAVGAAVEFTRKLYMGHRELLLSEATVSQLRGTFAVIRMWIFAGACLTLVGGLIYAFALANPTINQNVNARVTVTVQADTDAWKALASCNQGSSADITGLPALLVSSNDSDGLQDGPFSIVSVQSPCEGINVDVAEDEGSYQRSAPTTSKEDDTSASETTYNALVSISVQANSDLAAQLVRDCPELAPQLSEEPIRGLLSSSNVDDDAKQDGPFTALLTEPQCPGHVIDVEDGEATYTAAAN